MRFLLFIVFLLLLTNKVAGQGESEIRRRSSVFFEMGGNAYSYSINYDYKLSHIGFRAGANYFRGGMMRLATMNFFIGRKNNFIEYGIGVINHTNLSNTFLTMTLGYRYQAGGLIIRLGFTPIFATAYDTNQFIWPMAGFSAGYVFKSRKR